MNMRTFPYAPLQDGDIRLLRLVRSKPVNYELVHVRHADVHNQYVALSYCWGDPTPTENLIVSRHLVGIAKNLRNFLVAFEIWALSCPPDIAKSYFWVDAICINQLDHVEKSLQVDRMWQIYRDASEVVAWMGVEETYTRMAFDVLRMAQPGIPRPGEISALQLEDAHMSEPIDHWNSEKVASIVALSHNEYFSRMWIVPEVTRAQHVTLLSINPSGTKFYSVSFEKLRAWSRKYGLPASPTFAGRQLSHALDTLLDELEGGFRNDDGVVDASPSDAFGQTLIRHADRLCADPRDKIFAAKGLPFFDRFGEALKLKADYSLSLWEVAVDTLRYWGALLSSPLYHEDLRIHLNTIRECLGVDCASPSFLHWLRSYVRKSEVSASDILRTSSGVEIDCSGPLLQPLVHKLKLPRRLVEDPTMFRGMRRKRRFQILLKSNWSI